MTEELTGKPYEAGDLSIELDKRVKSTVADFCGKDAYEFGDLSKEIDRRVKNRVADYIGKDEYEFGDISRQIEKNRRAWVKDFLGEEAAGNYQFGDITKKAMANLTGQDDYQVRGIPINELLGRLKAVCLPYQDISFCANSFVFFYFQFGDVTKKLMGNIFGKKKLK